MEQLIFRIQNRINLLTARGSHNARIVAKLQRQLRRLGVTIV